MPIYKINGDIYDIPQDKIKEFESAFPDATVEMYSGSDIYDIPISRQKEFLSTFNGASYSPISNTQEPQVEKNDTLLDRVANAAMRLQDKAVQDNGAYIDTHDIRTGEKKPQLTQEEIEQREVMLEHLKANGTIDRMEEMEKEARKGKFKAFGEMLANAPQVSMTGVAAPISVEQAEKAMEAGAEYTQNKAIEQTLDIALDKARAGEVGGIGEANIGNGVVDLGLGLWDSATRMSTWDLGVSDTMNGLTIKNVLEKYESDPSSLTATENNLIDAMGMATAVQEAYADKVGVGYAVGESLPQSLGFMASMYLNPASGLGKAAMAKAATKYGQQSVKKYVARALGDVAETAIMTATTGGGRVVADAIDRINGQSTYEIDNNGMVLYGGQKDQETVGDAIWKAIGSNFIENYTEALGEYFDPIMGVAKGVVGGGLRKVNLNKFADWLTDAKPSETASAIRAFREKAKFGGLFGEVMEEELGMAMNALFVGDNNFGSPDDPNSIFNPETQLTTILSCAIMTGVLNGAESIGNRGTRKKYENNLSATERAAQQSLGDKFTEIKGALDTATPEQMVDILNGVLTDQSYDLQQKRLLTEYAVARVGMQYYNTTEEEGRKQLTDAQRNIVDAYEAGRHAQLPQFYGINNAVMTAEQTINQMPHAEELWSVIELLDRAPINEHEQIMRDLTDGDRHLVNDYRANRSRMEGVVEGRAEQVENLVQEYADKMGKHAYQKADGTREVATGIVGDEVVFIDDINEFGDAFVHTTDGNRFGLKIKDISHLQVRKLDDMVNEFRQSTTTAVDNETQKNLEYPVEVQEPAQGVTVSTLDGKQWQVAQTDGETVELVGMLFDKKSGQWIPNSGDYRKMTRKQFMDWQKAELDRKKANTYEQGDELTFYVGGGEPISAEITGITPEGKYLVQIDHLVDGLNKSVVDEYTIDELRELSAPSNNMSANQAENEGTPTEQIKQSVSKEITNGQTEENASEPIAEVMESVNTPQTKAAELLAELEADEVDENIAYNTQKAIDLAEEKRKAKPTMKDADGDVATFKALKAQWQAELEDAQRNVLFWNNVAKEVANARVASQTVVPEVEAEAEQPAVVQPMDMSPQPAKKAKKSRKREPVSFDGLSPESMAIANGIMADMAPQNGVELAAAMMSTGGKRIIPESFRKHTGYSTTEQKSFLGLIAGADKGGLTIEHLGELVMQADREDGTNFFDQNDANAGLNAVLEVLGQSETIGDVNDYIKRNREEAAYREALANENAMLEAEQEAKDAWYMEQYHATEEELAAYNEWLAEEVQINVADEAEYERRIITFAEQLADEYDNERTNASLLRAATAGEGNGSVVEGSSSVGEEERTDNTGEVLGNVEGRAGQDNDTADQGVLAQSDVNTQKPRSDAQQTNQNLQEERREGAATTEAGRSRPNGTFSISYYTQFLKELFQNAHWEERPSEEVAGIIRRHNAGKTLLARTEDERELLSALRALTNNEIQDELSNINNALQSDEYTDEEKAELKRAKNLITRFINRGERNAVIETLTGAKLGEKLPLSKIDELFEKYNSDADVAELYGRVRAIAEQIGLDFWFEEMEDRLLGGYLHSDNRVRLNAHMLYCPRMQRQGVASTIVHEMLHAVAGYAVYTQKDIKLGLTPKIQLSKQVLSAANTLINIYEKAVKGNPALVHQEYDIEKEEWVEVADYGTTSVHEMLSEISNPEFRDKLKQIEYNGRSVWQRIWDAIKSMFTQSSDVSNPTAYDSMAKALDVLINEFSVDAYQKYSGLEESAARVYHGSGALFDKFDYSFMGTGEGNQAFGWGAYVSEAEGVGKTYAKIASKPMLTYKGQEMNVDGYENPWRVIKDLYDMTRGKISQMRADAEKYGRLAEDDSPFKPIWGEIVAILKNARRGDIKVTPRRMLYEVEIPDDNGSNYLKWYENAPKEVLAKAKGKLYDILVEGDYKGAERELKRELDDLFALEQTGQNLYGNISAYLGSDKEASEFLHEMGYVGLKYPTNTLHGGNIDGTNNYVIFDENDLEIVDNIRFRDNKEKSPEIWLPEDESSFKGTAISSDNGAKILNNLDNAIAKYENRHRIDTFIGDVAGALGIEAKDRSSKYATFEAMNGDIVTLRISDHNATVSNFDNNEEENGVSIVISRRPNEGITNDGDAHVVEFFYSDKKLKSSEDKPLVEILKSIKQALYSGEYRDNTGLAEREEVNERLREGMGAISDREVSYENDPIAKFQGKPRYYGKRAAAFAERERRRMENAAKEAAEMLGIETEIVTDASTLQGRKAKAKGWYDIINKKVVVVVPNHVSMGDAVRTVLHEGVAHHGLRELFGDGFDAMLDNVYNNVSPELKARIDAIAERTGVSTQVATEEYLAGLAETTNFEEAQRRGWWAKIKQLFVDMLRKLSMPGINLKEDLTDNELRYLLWRSYKNLVEPNSYLKPLGYIDDVAKQKELKVGNYAEKAPAAPMSAEMSEAEESEAEGWAAITMQRIEELETQMAQLDSEIAEMEADRDADDASRYEMWEEQLDVLRKQSQEIYDELEGLYSLEAEAEEMSMASEDAIRYRLVEGPAEIERLESEPTIKAYRAMQVINGELYPPMSAVVDGKLREPIALGQWEQSEERPDLADDNGRFKLDKGNKKSLKAAYNPYFHSSSTPLNDQFSEAQDRDNLVTVEVEVPVSEADGTSGYKAEKAKDAVGTHQWKAGIIQGQLTGTREVFLTRWDKPIRIVPESEVADVIVEMFDGKDIVMPSNVVTPQLRKELEARGIAFVETDNQGKLVEGEHKGEHYSKVYGKKNTKKSKKNAEIIAEVEREAAALGVPVRIARSVDELIDDEDTRKRAEDGKLKGYFDTRTGEVVVYEPNTDDANDAKRTILHETVGHKGLRQLIGEERYDKAMVQLMYLLPADVRDAVLRRAERHGWNAAIAMDEYLAEQAERDVQPTWWGKVNAKIRALFRNMGFNVMLTDADVTYLLWRSRKKLQGDTAFDMATDAILKQAARKSVNYDVESDNSIRHRGVEQGKKISEAVSDYYEKYTATTNADKFWGGVKYMATHLGDGGTRALLNDLSESQFEDIRSVRVLEEAIESAEGKPLRENEMVHKSLNAKTSRDARDMDKSQARYFQPMAKLLGKILGKKIDGRKIEIDDVERYLICKHSPENNEFLMKRAHAENRRKKIHERAKELMKGTMTEEEAIAQATSEYTLHQSDFRDDYSGLTELFPDDMVREAKIADRTKELTSNGVDKVTARQMASREFESYEPTLEDREKMAADEVARFEAAVDGMHEELWGIINGINRDTIERLFRSGLISRSLYNDLKKRHKFYVPLSGWKNDAAADIYNYAMYGFDGTPIQTVIKKAFGTKYQARNILGSMFAMNMAAITEGNQNLVKQKLYNLALNHDTGVLQIVDLWEVKDGEGDAAEWKPAPKPELRPTMSDAEMQTALTDYQNKLMEMEKDGKARKAVNSLADNFGKHTTDKEAKRHHVELLVNGRKVVIWVNGNPKLAQAINGDLKVKKELLFFNDAVDKANRFLAQVQTSLNPEFMISNFERDILSASRYNLIKYGPKYEASFMKHLAQLMPIVSETNADMRSDVWGGAGIFNLFALDRNTNNPNRKPDAQVLDMNNPLHREFVNFLNYGGKTGYVERKQAEDLQQRIKKLSKREQSIIRKVPAEIAGWAVETIEHLNEGIENATRFAAYLTARERGKSVTEAVFEAKEVSVNFNMQGSGAWGNASFRKLYNYFNVGLQSLRKEKNLGREFPKAYIANLAFMMALGAISTVLLTADWDGDDEDEYMGLSDFNRYNYINVKTENGFIHYSLPQDLRAFYAIGCISTEWAMGKIDGSRAMQAYATQANNYTPLSFVSTTIDREPDSSPLKNLAMSFVPSAAVPVAEIAVNEDFLGRRIHNQNQWNEYEPEWQRAGYRTPEWVINASKTLSKVGGGTEHKRGVWFTEINPSNAWHIMDSYGGGFLDFAQKTYNLVERELTGEEHELRDYPMVSKFYVESGQDYSKQRVVNDRYRMYREDYETINNELNGYLKDKNNALAKLKVRAAEDNMSKLSVDMEAAAIEKVYSENVERIKNSPNYWIYESFEPYEKGYNTLDRNLDKARKSGSEQKEKEFSGAMYDVRKKLVEEIDAKRDRWIDRVRQYLGS